MNPATLDLLTVGAFIGVVILLFIMGKILLGGRRNELPGSKKRPLVFGPLTHLFAIMIPFSFESRESLDQELRRAGYYQRYARDEFLALRNVLVVGWLLLVFATFAAVVEPGSETGTRIVVVGLIIGLVLFSLPRLVLQVQATNRIKRIQYSLPDALDMLTMTMSGGLPLPRALEHVSREIGSTYPDLACELTIVRRHTETGSLEQALREFAKRIDIPDIQSMTALVSQTERLGSNVATAFRDYSDSVRRGQRQRAEERGNRASIAMILPIVLCLAPPIYILLLGPAVMKLRNFVSDETQQGGALRPDTTGLNDSVLSQNDAADQ